MTPLTVVKVLLALVPRAVIAAMQTTTIRASITAYSTAVGPSSRRSSSTVHCATRFMVMFRVRSWHPCGAGAVGYGCWGGPLRPTRGGLRTAVVRGVLVLRAIHTFSLAQVQGDGK